MVQDRFVHQKIETEMAREVGVKAFRTYTNSLFVNQERMGRISKAVKDWYESGRANTNHLGILKF